MSDKRTYTAEFPSPYWGLFFYQAELELFDGESLEIAVSVPILGIIFLSAELPAPYVPNYVDKFPSPYWGLFFYPVSFYVPKRNELYIVSVPILGIIFLSRKSRACIVSISLYVSVPILGIIFLSNSSSIMERY